MLKIGDPGFGCLEGLWDNECLVHKELCFRTHIAVLEYSRSELTESSPIAVQAVLDFILKVDIS